MRVEALMIDGSEFHVFEYVDIKLTKISYAYHFQDRDGKLVFRYDNEPHFPRLPGFPHHKHVSTSSSPMGSKPVEIRDAIREAAKAIAESNA